MTVTVKLDKYGKIFIPREIRDMLHSNEFEVIIENEHLELIPVKKPLDLFGTLKGIDKKELEKLHGEEHDLAS